MFSEVTEKLHREQMANKSCTVGKWILQFITDVNVLLSRITAYCDKENIKLPLQAPHDLLSSLFAFHYQHYLHFLPFIKLFTEKPSPI